MQSPFFNKINPLGICETALWAVKCLRTFIKRKTADLRNHLAQCFFADVGIGIVDEHARVGVAAGVDIQVYAELFALRDGRNYRENKSAGLP